MIKNQPLTERDLRKFGLIMAGMLALISLIPVYREHWTGAFVLWGIAGILFLLPGLLFPSALRPVHRVWMKIGMALGWVNQRIILSAVFFLLFTPISLVQKVISRDPLDRKLDPAAKSYWTDRSQESYNPKHFERQF